MYATASEYFSMQEALINELSGVVKSTEGNPQMRLSRVMTGLKKRPVPWQAQIMDNPQASTPISLCVGLSTPAALAGRQE